MASTPIENLIPQLLEAKEIEIPGTLTDPLLREVYKNEILVLQRMIGKMQDMNMTPSPDWLAGIYMGMETFARRLQEIQQAGLKNVYAENLTDSK
jgi:hypothetical protein